MSQFHKVFDTLHINHFLFVFLIFVATILPSAGIHSQEYKYEYELYTSENGLPSNGIYDLAFDQKGMMWISTQSGIAKFDGNQFEVLDHVSNDNSYGNIEIDRNGSLWLLSNNTSISFPISEKLKFYDNKTKKLQSVIEAIPGAKEFLKDKGNFNILTDEANNIYLRSSENRQTFQYIGDSLRYIGDQKINTGFNQQSIENTFIFLDSLQYKSINLSTKKITKFDATYPDKAIIINDSLIFTGKFDNSNESVSNEKVLTVTNTKNDTIINENSQSLNYISHNNRLFISTDYGLIEHNLETNEVLDINNNLNGLFDDNRIKKIAYHNNALWVIAYKGLYKVIRTKAVFKNALVGELGDSRNIIQYDNDNILIANGNGITKLNLLNGQETPLLKLYLCYGITQVDSFRYLLSSYSQNISIWDIRTPNSIKSPKFTDISSMASEKVSHFIFSYKDPNNRIWLSSREGIYKYDIDNSTIERVNSREGDYYYSDLIENQRDSNTFFATKQNGLEKVNINTGQIKSYQIFENKNISDIYQDKRDSSIYWVSTRTEGLLKWKYEENIIRRYTLADGLKSMDIHSAKQDKEGNLWMSTNNGISILDQKTDKINTFTTIHGIHNNEYNRHSHLSVGDSIFIFGGVDGITYFKPNETVITNELGPTAIIGISYLNKLTGKEVTDQIENPSNSVVKLKSHYLNSALLISKPTNAITQTLRFIVAERKEDWRYTQNNVIPLNDLEEGKNNIIISRQIGINKWSKPKSIMVYKPIPWYKNIFSYIVALALIFLGFLFFQSRRYRQIEKTNKEIKNRVKSQTIELSEKNQKLIKANTLNDQLFSIIGHDLRSPLISLNNVSKSLTYLVEIGEIDDLKKLTNAIENNSSDSLHILDNLLNWAQMQRNEVIENTKISLPDVINQVIEFNKGNITRKNIQLKVINTSEISLMTEKQSLIVILRNILSNAVKYSHHRGKVDIEILQKDNKTLFKIRDYGVGISKKIKERILSNDKLQPEEGTDKEQGLGLGLKITFELIEKIGGSIIIQRSNPGTLVIVSI